MFGQDKQQQNQPSFSQSCDLITAPALPPNILQVFWKGSASLFEMEIPLLSVWLCEMKRFAMPQCLWRLLFVAEPEPLCPAEA